MMIKDAARRVARRLVGYHEPSDLPLRLFTTTELVRSWEPMDRPLVSVIMPTYNRASILPRAMGSVLRSTYSNLELVVVNDGSEDDTVTVVGRIDDPRVRFVNQPNGGLQNARNSGLDAASGEYICYLDDDNFMHPEWLKAVVWAFDYYPHRVLYGARIIEDDSRRGPWYQGAAAGPLVDLPAFDYAALQWGNFIDANALAHHAGIDGSRFPEAGLQSGDYGQVLALAEHHRPFLALPAVACLYLTRHEGRMSLDPARHEEYESFVTERRHRLGL